MILLIVLFVILTVLILLKPYLGIVFMLVSLPLVDLLPVIPLFSSVIVLIGLVTLVVFLFQRRNKSEKRLFNFERIHIVGLLFIGWVFISNPQAASLGINRNWLLTLFQLWVLVWLTGELLDSPEKQHIFMWLFSITSAIAAIIAIRQGDIGDMISTSTRAIGLAGNPNMTGRYFVVAMIFFSYLSTITKKYLLRILSMGGVIVTFLGVFFTLSRSSILLLIVAIGLQTILKSRRKFSISVILPYIVSALIMWFLYDQITNILKSILPSILQGTDTAGLRYKLWQAAWSMWSDHIIRGVGIGMFNTHLQSYAMDLAPYYFRENLHNTYLQVLTETGLVGLFLFFGLMILSIKNFLKSSKIADIRIISLRNVWLVVFIVVLLGEITVNGLPDKLLWFLFGISVYFHNRFSTRPQNNAVPEQMKEIRPHITEQL